MKLQTTQKDGKLYGKLPDTGWIDIQFTSNDWKAREGSIYTPKFRKIGNIVFLQGQFATKQVLNAGNHSVYTTNLPPPSRQHTICTCSFLGNMINMWFTNNNITFKVYDNNFIDTIGVSIDSCYIAD